jgi:uncharacterized membrane protein
MVKAITLELAMWVEAAGALVIAVAVVEATLGGALLFARRGPAAVRSPMEVRLRLGWWLSLALEFELAADILRTAVAPTWDEIGKLAAIAALRTLLNHFLQREIEEMGNGARQPPVP